MAAPVLFVLLLAGQSFAQTQVGNYASHATSAAAWCSPEPRRSLRVTPYGDYMVRVQVAKKGESFYADDRYGHGRLARLGGTLEYRMTPRR